jgi:NADH-ubiquinone oxidoreductase chain 6
MSTLIVLNEIFTNGYKDIFLYIASLLSIISGILILITKNPIISILFLISLFLSISGYLILLGMNFIGISYLLVYIGAVSILFLFILMLINIRVSELLSETSNSIPLAVIIGISFTYPIYQTLPNFSFARGTNIINYTSYGDNYLFTNAINKVYFVTSNIWDGNLAENTHITSIGNIMYTSHSLWLILTSVLLLLAMVGVIVITINQKN